MPAARAHKFVLPPRGLALPSDLRAATLGRRADRAVKVGIVIDENGYKEYLVADDTVKARKSAGGLVYDVVLPDGSHIVNFPARVFEDMAIEVKP